MYVTPEGEDIMEADMDMDMVDIMDEDTIMKDITTIMTTTDEF